MTDLDDLPAETGEMELEKLKLRPGTEFILGRISKVTITVRWSTSVLAKDLATTMETRRARSPSSSSLSDPTLHHECSA